MTKTKPRAPVPTDILPLHLEDLLLKYLANLEQGKFFYEQADQSFQELLPLLRRQHIRRLTHPTTGEVFELTDNFRGKNVSYKPCGVRRFELKQVKRKKPQPAA